MTNRKKATRQHRRGHPRLPLRASLEQSSPPISLSHKLTNVPVKEMLAAIEEFKSRNNQAREVEPESSEISLFSAAVVRPFSLRFDRPEKIIGCKARDGGYEYVIMYRCGPPVYAGFSVASHAELMASAPWLLSEYIIQRCKVTSTP